MRQIAARSHGYPRRLLVIAGFIAVWHLVSISPLGGGAVIFPTPIGTVNALGEIIASDTFVPAILVSAARVAAGLAIVVVFSGTLVSLSIYSDYVDIFTRDVVFVLLYTVPGLLWVILILIMLGLSWVSPILIVALLAAPHFIINLKAGLTDLDTDLLEVGDAFGTQEQAIMRHTVIPQLYPNIIAGLRSGITSGGKAVVFAEFFTSLNGVGAEVKRAFTHYNGDMIAAWAIIVLVILLAFDRMLRHIDTTMLRQYRQSTSNGATPY